MLTWRLTITTLALGASLTAETAKKAGPADEGKPSPVAAISTNELHEEEKREALRLRQVWLGKDDDAAIQLPQAVATTAAHQAARQKTLDAKAAKEVEMRAWKLYYERSAQYWRGVYKEVQDGAPDRAKSRQDLVNAVQFEERDRAEAQRRLADLTRALADGKLDPKQEKSIQQLQAILAQKERTIRMARKALEQADLGTGYLEQQKELARQMAFQAGQLGHGMEVEGTLWDAVYRGRLHRLDLEFRKLIPPPHQPEDVTDRIEGGVR